MTSPWPALEREVAAWTTRRNTHNAKANWRFTPADARIKLKSLYPAGPGSALRCSQCSGLVAQSVTILLADGRGVLPP